MKDVINYSKLIDQSMYVIVYKVLTDVMKNGLPGDHHFFISFATKHKGVKISRELLKKYPIEMTIILQYQYEDLKVDSKGFSVLLSFNGVKGEIRVPFAAITTFADPSVQFGLQFRDLMSEKDIFTEAMLEDPNILEIFTDEVIEDLLLPNVKHEEDRREEHKAKKKSCVKGERSKTSPKSKSKASNVIDIKQYSKKKR